MKILALTMPDGSKWAVPVDLIAQNRAAHYASEFDGDIQRSLDEDTLPYFNEDRYAIEDWAANNMNWSDFNGHQYMIKGPDKPNFAEAWVNGEKEVLEWSAQ